MNYKRSLFVPFDLWQDKVTKFSWSCCAVLSHSVESDSSWPHGLQPTRLLCPWGFSRQEYWSGLPCPPPGDLPNPGITPRSPTMQADSFLSEPPGKPFHHDRLLKKWWHSLFGKSLPWLTCMIDKQGTLGCMYLYKVWFSLAYIQGL